MEYTTSYKVIDGDGIAAIEFATDYRIIIYLKDGRTIVADAVKIYEPGEM
jgi:transcriptional antiterminator Rof (Rho-off)